MARGLRLLRHAGLLAPGRAHRVLGPRNHDGTISTRRARRQVRHRRPVHHEGAGGQATVFIVGAYGPGVATGLSIRYGNGSQYTSDVFQTELRFLGAVPSPSFVHGSEGSDCGERVILTLKEQLRWVRTFPALEAAGVPRRAGAAWPYAGREGGVCAGCHSDLCPMAARTQRPAARHVRRCRHDTRFDAPIAQRPDSESMRIWGFHEGRIYPL